MKLLKNNLLGILALGIIFLFPMATYAQAPAMTFDNTEYDFGSVTQGEVVNHTFKFENTGDTPLIISDVKTTCGCTVPQWPQEPIPPKSFGEIKVKFNSSGKNGLQNKIVTIMANTKGGKDRVVLKGTVKSKG